MSPDILTSLSASLICFLIFKLSVFPVPFHETKQNKKKTHSRLAHTILPMHLSPYITTKPTLQIFTTLSTDTVQLAITLGYLLHSYYQ